VLTQIEKLKQAAAAAKLNAAVAWIADRLDESKLVLFASHTFVVERLMQAFGDRAVRLTGADDAAARQVAVDRFQTEESVRLFVGNLKAAGVGLTLTAASDVAFLELAWTPADHDQAEDRLHRIGQRGSVTAWYLLAADTIDEDIVELLERKRQVIAGVTDGDFDLAVELGLRLAGK
jgi:SNF2 family DNA or RNA helicase